MKTFLTHSISLYEHAQEDEELSDDELLDALEEYPQSKSVKTIYHDEYDMEDDENGCY